MLLRNGAWVEPIIDLNVDIAIAAMRCDLTRVVNFSWEEHRSTAAASHHNLHHSPDDPFWRGEMLKVDAWYSRKLSQMLAKMDAIVEGNGKTMLDNSLVMYGKEMSSGFAHVVNDFQAAFFGGLNGRVRTNQYIQMENGKPRSYNQLLITIMQAFGLQPSAWEVGGQTGFGQYNIGNSGADRATIVDKRAAIPGMLV